MITDFTSLKAAAGAHYGNRSDLVPKWDLFTQLAETEINGFLRVNPQQAVTTLTSAAGVITLPSDALKAQTIRQTEARKPRIQWTDMAGIEAYLSEVDQTGDPHWAAEVDGTIYLAAEPDDGVTFRVAYTRRVPALSGSAPTNWLLTRRPDIYLFGLLEQAGVYDHDDQARGTYREKFITGLAGLDKSEREDKWGMRLEMQPNGGVA
jgi:hypothetical protein